MENGEIMKEVAKDAHSGSEPDQYADFYSIYGIAKLKNQNYLVLIIDQEEVANINNHRIFKAKEISLIGLGPGHKPEKDDEKQLLMMANFLSRDHLHFCNDGYDLTLSLEKNFPENDEKFKSEKRFIFNENCLRELGKFKYWGDNVVSGFISTEETDLEGRKVKLTIFSRREKNRTGMRFLSRGIDTAGYVSNFADNEQILEIEQEDGKKRLHSFNQTRGSIPVFWKQTPNFKWSPPLVIAGNVAQRKKSFGLHMNRMVEKYKNVFVVNLIDKKKTQKRLGDVFTECYEDWKGSQENYVWFDFHHECRKMQWHNLSKLIELINGGLEEFGYFEANVDGEKVKVGKHQKGVFRVNCMDNLDRTNVVQSVIARGVVLKQLHQVNSIFLKNFLG